MITKTVVLGSIAAHCSCGWAGKDDSEIIIDQMISKHLAAEGCDSEHKATSAGIVLKLDKDQVMALIRDLAMSASKAPYVSLAVIADSGIERQQIQVNGTTSAIGELSQIIIQNESANAWVR